MTTTTPTPTTTRTPGRVLIADDEEFIRKLLRRTLTSTGAAISTAADGLEAIRAAECDQPDVVVIDMGMPRCNGLAAIEAMVRMDPAPEIVVLSGETSTDQEAALARLGVRCVLSKPFKLDTVRAVVEAALKRSQQRREAAPRRKRARPLRDRIAVGAFLVAGMLWGVEGVIRVGEWIGAVALS